MNADQTWPTEEREAWRALEEAIGNILQPFAAAKWTPSFDHPVPKGRLRGPGSGLGGIPLTPCPPQGGRT
jgi:hypothetical protein